MHTHHVRAWAAFVAAFVAAIGALPAAVHAQDGGTAQQVNPGLLACRSIGDAAARLACYDALPLAGPAAADAPAARPQAAAAAAPPVPPAATAASFGIDKPAQGELQEVSSSVTGAFEGWSPASRIQLANGQAWQVTDGSSAAMYLHSPRVKVKRALLGGYVMEFEGSNRTAKVRRVQ